MNLIIVDDKNFNLQLDRQTNNNGGDVTNCWRSVKVELIHPLVGGAVASWLVRSTPERAVRVRALVGDIVLCSWARHFTLTVPLSTQVYKWVPANLMLGVTL